MTRSTTPFALLLALVLLPGCGFFFVEAADSRVCKTVFNAVFAPGIQPPQSATQTQPFDYNFGAELLQLHGKGVETDVRILGITFTSHDQATNLAFIDTVQIELSAVSTADGGVPGLQVLRYQKVAGADPGVSVTLKGDQDHDITAYLKAGALHLTTTVSGVFPPQPWALDMTTCLAVKAHYDYL